MEILNLYAGIGGNRKLWDNVQDIDINVTAVEKNKTIASIYQDFFPEDNVIRTDAHQYLKENFKEYDFIWSSPPCPTHSRTALFANSEDQRRGHHLKEPKYPDMRLYEEVLFLDYFYKKGNYCVENVISFYEPLITPQKRQRHYFWADFTIPPIDLEGDQYERGSTGKWEKQFGFDLSEYTGKIDKRKVIRNCTHPKLGKIILETSLDIVEGHQQEGLFKDKEV